MLRGNSVSSTRRCVGIVEANRAEWLVVLILSNELRKILIAIMGLVIGPQAHPLWLAQLHYLHWYVHSVLA